MTGSLIATRSDADEKAREAIDAVERELLKALGGETLRGLPELGDGIYGFRLGEWGVDKTRLFGTKPQFVLEAKGMLVLASMHGKTAFVQRAPRGTIRASLLVSYLRAVEMALGIHANSAERREAQFRRVVEIGERVVAAMR